MFTNSTFRYPYDYTPAAFLRRIIISFILAFCFSYSVFGYLQLFNLLHGFGKLYLTVSKMVSHVPVNIYWDINTRIIITIIFASTLLASKIPYIIEFFLFPRYDDKILRPVSCYTGIFLWNLPDTGLTRNTWDALINWVKADEFHGRWSLKWILDRPTFQRPFDWTILCGANGIGKSQLAKELARHFGQRTFLGNAGTCQTKKQRLKIMLAESRHWFHRVIPFIKTVGDPWDSGLLIEVLNNLNDLQNWRPRTATFLILDDPPISTCSQVINILNASKKNFWYPVRLLIVEQFIPGDLPIKYMGTRWVHEENMLPFRPYIMQMEPFTTHRFYLIVSKGYWLPNEIALNGLTLTNGRYLASLCHPKEVPLVKAVEGNPLLLGFAVLWLDMDHKRTVYNLIQIENIEEEEEILIEQSDKSTNLMTLVGHRLIRDRVNDLYNDICKFETRHQIQLGALRYALCLATICGEISFDLAQEEFQLKVDDNDLHRVLIYSGDTTSIIPPIQPWLIGDRFVAHFFKDVMRDNLNDIKAFITKSLRINPHKTLKVLGRPGRIPHFIADALVNMQMPEDPKEQIIFLEAMIRYSLWNNRDYIHQVIHFAGNIDESVVAVALSKLAHICSDPSNPSIYDNVNHLALYATLAARLTFQDTSKNETQVIQSHLNLLLSRVNTISILYNKQSKMLESCLYSIINGLFKQYLAGNDVEANFTAFNQFLKLIPYSLNRLFLFRNTPELLRLSDANYHQNTPIMQIYLRLWEICFEKDSDLCEVLAMNLVEYVDALPIPDIPGYIQGRLNACALCYIARARSEKPNQIKRTVEIAKKVEDIARRFPDDEIIQEKLAIIWSYVAHAHSKTTNHFTHAEEAVNMVEKIARQFPNNETILLVLANTWRKHVYDAYAGKNGTAQLAFITEAMKKFEEIAHRFPQNELIQSKLMDIWNIFSHICSEIHDFRTYTEIVAEKAEKVAHDFPQNDIIQDGLADIWHHIAYARSQIPNQRARTEEAAERVEELAQQFPHNKMIQFELMQVWQCVTFARSNMPEQRARTSKAAEKVREIAHQFGYEDESIKKIVEDTLQYVAQINKNIRKT